MTALLTTYVLMWPVIVLGILVTIASGFIRDIRTAKKTSGAAGRSRPGPPTAPPPPPQPFDGCPAPRTVPTVEA
ncbi:MAG: hypothetical protein DI635_16535 [Pseudoxanthomonas suwonensis]|nr:MAG: hypothetical protein DI635_16535 [Pseudoxanthomonas suwonensis]